MRRLLALILLLSAGCGGPVLPEVVPVQDLEAALRPRGGERLVLANFWATW